ncbi:MAG TPA: glycerol-3-phosphate dehydrogenase/oxidase [Candidatus Dormibacteraeota bacterium]|nr:glycerol-3-phosphate dehydrogenase/oxidase [Candidatus Dormibacteraeota bacterium]
MSTQEFSSLTRKENLDRMSVGNFDLIIIGGGITGAAVSRDAAIRGFKVALLEKGDFASGTSSRSSKLIHGGLRYLRHAKFGLVFGSLRERWRLRRNAPRFIKPLTFLIPVYEDSRTGKLQLSLGLWLYDLLALFRTEQKHEWLGPERVKAREPMVRRDRLVGGGLYSDFLTDDALLVLAIVKDSWTRGALVANYTEVVGFEKENGRIVGVRAVDLISGTQLNVHGKIVVNATGPWSDELRKLDDPSSKTKLRPAKGTHLLLPRRLIGNKEAVVLESRRDGRNLFVVPWGDLCLVGTTDTDYHGDLDHIAPSLEDVEYILESLREYFPDGQVTEEDIVSSYAAVRPLAAELGVTEDDVSRDQLIFESTSGLVSIIGGKLTTHRSMAEALVNQVSGKLMEDFATRPVHACETHRLPLDCDEVVGHAVDKLMQESNVEQDVATHLVEAYGPDATKVIEIARENEGLLSRVAAGTPYIFAEARYAARHQMAMKLVDFMFRRTQLAIRLKDHGRSVARNIAKEMANELGWGPKTLETELIDFERACTLIEATRGS